MRACGSYLSAICHFLALPPKPHASHKALPTRFSHRKGPGKHRKVHGDLRTGPGNLHTVPGNLLEYVGDLRTMPGNLRIVPGNVLEYRGNLRKVRGNLLEYLGNLRKVIALMQTRYRQRPAVNQRLNNQLIYLTSLGFRIFRM